MSEYPSSSLAYPLLNQLLDSLTPFPVSSTASTFTLSTMDTSSSVVSSTNTSSSVTSSSSSSSVSSTSTLQPPLSSLVTTTTLQPPLSSLTTTLSLPLPVMSSLPQPTVLPLSTPPLHPQDAVATAPNLQQYSAVRQLTNDLQIKKPRHPKRPQLSTGNHPPVRRLVHTVVYKQKLAQYIDALKLYEKHHLSVVWSTQWSINRNLHNILMHSNCMKNF